MSYITAIGTANPVHRFEQSSISEFMSRTMRLDEQQRRKLRAIFTASGIQHRYSVIEDYGRTGNFSFFSKVIDGEIFPTTKDRNNVFVREAPVLSALAVQNLLEQHPGVDLQQVTHLIVVSCTGMYAPGLDIDLVKHLKLRPTVQRTAINFMGCYAAFNALKIADTVCSNDNKAKVLIVCTELCSLHFQADGTEDNLLANALFGDGSAAVMVEGTTASKLRISIEAFHTELALHAENQMAWSVGDMGFEMKLSAYVPDTIRAGIKQLTESLLRKIEKRLTDIKHFAIHPGGKKILQVIEQQLGISPVDNRWAYDVLRKFGNMSSATVLFVIRELLAKAEINQGDRVLSFAFGPGLTLESMVLNIERNDHA